MSDETVFYILGIALAVSAVALTFAGLKLKSFPGRAFPVVVLWFVALVGGATTYSVLQAKEHEEAHASELHAAEEQVEEAESGGHGNEAGALGGETEELEEEAEEEAEGEGGEPTGETGGSQEAEKPAGGGAAATTLKLAADPAAIAFDKTMLEAKPGKVTIDFDNPSAIPHNVVIEEGGKEIAGTPEITEAKASVSADLAAGDYTFLCTVPGHAEAGMEGSLTVK